MQTRRKRCIPQKVHMIGCRQQPVDSNVGNGRLTPFQDVYCSGHGVALSQLPLANIDQLQGQACLHRKLHSYYVKVICLSTHIY